MKKRGLGQGLSALIGNNIEETITSDSSNSIENIPINEIKPNKNQPRKVFNKEKLEELAQSIKEHGIIQPIIVKKMSTYYQIIAGERRYRAAQMANLTEIPVIVKDYNPKEVLEIALIENIQRHDLNVIEEAEAYDKLIKSLNITQEELASKLGKSRTSITNTLRLLKLTKEVQQLIIEEKLTFGHARTLITLPNSALQNEVAQYIIDNKLSVRETEEYIKTLVETEEEVVKPNSPKKLSDEYKDLENSFRSILSTKVVIKKGKKKNKIEIEYYTEEDLERIYSLICN